MQKDKKLQKQKEEVRGKRIGWIIWLAVLVLSAYIVPYLFLNNLNRVSGAFLYWTIFAIAAIISTFRIISIWRD